MDIQTRCDKIAAECQTPLFRKMKSLNAITKRNCSQIIQESGDFLWIPFLCPGYHWYHSHHRNNVRITPLWYLNYRPMSATPERGARGPRCRLPGAPAISGPLRAGPQNECKWVTLASGLLWGIAPRNYHIFSFLHRKKFVESLRVGFLGSCLSKINPKYVFHGNTFFFLCRL